jgi:16S rRNA (uracil1498-N3)-methyltransferase
VGNGAGVIVEGVARSVSPTELVVEVVLVSYTDRPATAVWLVQALAKGDRDELAVQAATELGIDGVVPWSAARSVSRWEGAKVAKGEERWRAIVREASKQSIRAWLPEVAALTTTKQLARLADSARLIVLDPTAETALTALLPDTRDVMLLVGPEGGISSEELAVLYNAGAEGFRLGTGILRTSTAGPAAVAVLNAKLGRW